MQLTTFSIYLRLFTLFVVFTLNAIVNYAALQSIKVTLKRQIVSPWLLLSGHTKREFTLFFAKFRKFWITFRNCCIE